MAAMDSLTIGEFNSATETFDGYYRRFINLLKAKTITNAAVQNATFLTVMGKETYQLLSSLLSPDSPDDKSCQDNYRTLLAHFQPKTIVILETFHFYKRNQLPGESISDYLAQLRHLAVRCDFGDGLDRALRDRFVCGISSDATQKRLLTESDLTLKKALQIAQAIEAGEKSSKIIKQNGNGSSDIFKVTPAKQPNRQQPNCQCFRCLSSDHLPSQCYHRNAICFGCNAKGHIRRACKRNRDVQDEPGSGRHQQRSTQPGAGSRDGVHAVSAGNDETVPQESSFLGCNAAAADDFDVLSVEYCDDGAKVNSDSVSTAEVIKVSTSVNEKSLCFVFDTGSSATIISSDLWSAIPNAALQPCHRSLRSFCGSRTVPLGEFTANVRVLPDNEAKLKIVVVSGDNRTAIMGRNAIHFFPEIREFARQSNRAASGSGQPSSNVTAGFPTALMLLIFTLLVLFAGSMAAAASSAKPTTSAVRLTTTAAVSTTTPATTTTPSLRQLIYAEYVNPDVSETRRNLLKPILKELYGDEILFGDDDDDDDYDENGESAGSTPSNLHGNGTFTGGKRKQMFLFNLVRTNYYLLLAVILAVPLVIYICLWQRFRNPASCHFVVPPLFRRRKRLRRNASEEPQRDYPLVPRQDNPLLLN